MVRKKAQRLVQKGQARWLNFETVEFVSDDPRHLAAVANARQFLTDGTGKATLDQIAGLPVVADPVKLITDTSKSPRRSSVGRAGKANQLRTAA